MSRIGSAIKKKVISFKAGCVLHICRLNPYRVKEEGQ